MKTKEMIWSFFILLILCPIVFFSSEARMAIGQDAQTNTKPHPALVNVDSAKCLSCHEEWTEKKVVHSPIKEESCDTCHEMKKVEKKTFVSLVESGSTLCLTCHSEIEDKLKKKYVHAVVEEGCDTCHDPHASDNLALLTSNWEELCSDCHDLSDEDFKNKHGRQPVVTSGCNHCHDSHGTDEDKLLLAKFIHAPFEDGDCTACHKRPRGPVIRLRGEGSALCYACHSDKEEEYAKNSVHTPVKNGECSACHDPHLGNFEFFLKNEGNKLCFECHEETAHLMKMDNVHPPAEESCLNCHDVHASDHAFNLTENITDSCLGCHDPDDGEFKPVHFNQDVKNLDCEECHNPHGSENEKLLNTFAHPPFLEKSCDDCHLNGEGDSEIKLAEGGGNELCFVCHDEDEIAPDQSDSVLHGAIETDGCATCHSPHASSHAHLLKDRTSRLCLSCHSEREEERESGKYIHPVIDSLGCQACHESHFSRNKGLLIAKPNDLCLECHLYGKVYESSGEDVTLFKKIKIKRSELASMTKILLSGDLKRDHPQKGHPVSGNYIPDEERDKDKKITDLIFAGEITCLTCHDSHAGASPLLFADSLSSRTQICLKCHVK